MKWLLPSCLLLFFLPACSHRNKNIIDQSYVDSLLTNYRQSPYAQMADSNLIFWQERMHRSPDNFVAGPRYASALLQSFHTGGNLDQLRKTDSLVGNFFIASGQKDPDLLKSLVSLAMTQHRFREADSLLKKAITLDGYDIPNAFLDFDVSFERGDYAKAQHILRVLSKDHSYAYLFRRSKYEHYDGSLDSSIWYMMEAVKKAGNNRYLQQVALSNAGDLLVHKGNPSRAADLYKQNIGIDGSDLHSIMGLGWIALVHDKNPDLAERIFNFVQNYSKAPDVWLKLISVAELKKDTGLQKQYARQFERMVIESGSESMYVKYLVDLYTGILDKPREAVRLAQTETYNRPTPQVYAWYAWSLYADHQQDSAYKIFKGFVSQKPLEGLELFYMGRMMHGLKKDYNANQFFKAAYKNRYDLSPSKFNLLEIMLD